MLGARVRRIFNADLMQSLPNQLNRPTLCREIPNIAGDYTMGPTNAAHFSKRLRSIRYKVNYKSRNNDVEGVVREQQLCESATRKSIRCAIAFLRAISICGSDGSIATTVAGEHVLTIRSVKTPVPQPISSQRASVGGASQSRKIVPMAWVQRPMNCSYAVPSLKRCVSSANSLLHRRD